jgi:DNA-binding response OmpR family regulator
MADVLLIEPNHLLAKSYKHALEGAGHKVRLCVKGQAAIEMADKRTPELIILELQLPGHNGLEFLYELRSYKEWQNIPVVILSIIPRGEVEDTVAWSLLNVGDYLYKPTTRLKQLIQAVDALVPQTII